MKETQCQRLAHARRDRGLSQADVAEALQLSRQAVSRWEAGAASPSTENLLRLAQLYGVTLDELLNGPAAPAQAPETSPVPEQSEPEPEPVPKAKPRISRKGLIYVICALCACVVGLIICVAILWPESNEPLPLKEADNTVLDISSAEYFPIEW